jgi:hypothetical protein
VARSYHGESDDFSRAPIHIARLVIMALQDDFAQRQLVGMMPQTVALPLPERLPADRLETAASGVSAAGR